MAASAGWRTQIKPTLSCNTPSRRVRKKTTPAGGEERAAEVHGCPDDQKESKDIHGGDGGKSGITQSEASQNDQGNAQDEEPEPGVLEPLQVLLNHRGHAREWTRRQNGRSHESASS